MISDPIFIVGTERSGSNLLRLLLNAHPHIAIPHPPHVMRDMAPFEKVYGDLSQDARFLRLAGDMARLVNMHFAPWPFAISGDELAKSASVRSLYGVYAALYERYLKHTGKKRWGCKSTFMGRHIDEIRANHRGARFLHLVRDPRDVAASAQQSIFSKYHPYCQARLWCEEQEHIESRAGNDLLRIHYEDLTREPEREVRRIMEFLNEEYLPAQMQFFRGDEAEKLARLSESWKNCAAPVSDRSVGGYRAKLKPEEIAWVEHEAGPLMKIYGYEAEGVAREPGRVERAKILVNDRTRMMSTEAKAFFNDKNFGLRWKKWFLIQYLKSVRSMDYGRNAGKNQNL